jgi:hypothetical protein
LYQKVKEILNNTKGMENRTLEMTSAAGTKYQFVEVSFLGNYVSAYSWYSNKWNRLTVHFKSLEEAQEWVKELDRKYEVQKNAPKTECRMSASSYYSITGYYGD